MKHAARGTREIQGETQPLEDDAREEDLRQIGRRLVHLSILLATALTAATLFLPA